jgi:hypothetical protein
MVYTPRFFRKMALLNKLEATYGTDVTPLPADRIIMSNVQFRPLVAQRLSRDLLLPYFGNQGVVLAGMYATIEGDIEIAGSGDPGTPPLWGSVARIAGMTETITADTSVVYERSTGMPESGTVYFVADGVRHVLLGSRANLALNWQAVAMPRMRASITGLLGTITDAANPAVSTAGWLAPVPVSKENTTLTLHGWSAVGQSLSVDFGNKVTPRFLIGDEAVHITDQSATGTAVVEAVSLATIDWFARAKARTRGVLDFKHGIIDGNIVEIDAAAVEIGEPTPGESDGFLNYSLGLDIIANNGLDLKITVR